MTDITLLKTSKPSSDGVGRALIMLVLVAVLPLLLFGGGVAWVLMDQKKTAFADELAGIARALSVAVDHELNSQMAMLASLATDHSLHETGLADFTRQAQNFSQAQQEWRNVVLFAPHTHRILASTSNVTPAFRAGLANQGIDNVVRTRRPLVIGAFGSGTLTAQPAILLLFPVLRAGEVRFVLALAVSPAVINDVFLGQRLSSSWTGAIVDNNMVLAGRSRGADQFVGKPATATLTARIATSDKGMFTALNQEGASMYTVFSRSAHTGWSVALGIPAEEVEAPIRNVLIQLALSGGVLMSFALILAAIAGRNIVRRRNAYEHTLQEGQTALNDKMRELKTILDSSGVGISLVRERRQIWANQRMADIFGYSTQEMQQLSTSVFYHSFDEYEAFGLQGYASLNRGERYTAEMEMRRKDGSAIWIRTSGQRIDKHDVSPGSIWVFEDISEFKRIDSEREEALSRLQKIASRLPGMVLQLRMRTDGSMCIPYVSQAVQELCRLTEDQLRDDAAPLFAMVHPDDLAKVQASMLTSAEKLEPWEHEFRLHFVGEPDLWVFGNTIPQLEADGSVLWHGFITNITERKTAEQQLRIAAAVFEAQEGMLVTDANTVILRVNRAFTDITGYSAEEVIGRKMTVLKSGRHDAAFYTRMWQALHEHDSWQGEIWNRRKSGEVYPEWLTITAVRDVDGAVAQYVGTLTDITSRKAAEDEVKQLAFYDPLTKLPNRRLLLDRLQQALALSTRSKRWGALFFIDLDNFKTLNDTLGHDVGDLLLQHVAQRLNSCVRECDTVARLGGDEFVVMLKDLSHLPGAAITLAGTVGHQILGALNQPYALAERPHHCTASLGATLFCAQQQTVDELMKRADLAMYDAKAAGRNTMRFFDPQMQAAVTTRATLQADLHAALHDRAFQLYYQGQFDDCGRITGAEALLRWISPSHGVIAPALFIPLAEEIGLILPLGLWVLETACQQLVAWAKQADTAHLKLAVNVSAVQFRQEDFVEQVLTVIEGSGANPHQLKLELTESLLLEDVEQIILKMSALKAHGIGFSLDDFGTGYSSLSYLKRLPLDQLKIDQSFVRDLLTDPNDVAIARTIVALARGMGLAVIAEGVETVEQRNCLASEGCYAYQGYLFGRPVPIAQFEASLRSATHNSNGLVAQA